MQSTQSDDGSLDIYLLNEKEQLLTEIIPFVWSHDRHDRQCDLNQVGEELQSFLLSQDDPKLEIFAMKKLNTLINQSPYKDISEYFEKFGKQLLLKLNLWEELLKKKKRISSYFRDSDIPDLNNIKAYLDCLEQGSHIFYGQVKKVNIDRLGSEDDWDENEFTYDSQNELKQSFKLMIMEKLSFLKLQKLLSDLYVYGNQKITNLSMIQLLFPDYLKISLSILKKVFHNSVFDPQTTSFLCILAAAGSECEYIINEMSERYVIQGGDVDQLQKGYKSFKVKFRKMALLFKLLSKGEIVSCTKLIKDMLSWDKDENIKDSIWTKQQIMFAIILCSAIQCECTIQQIFGIQSEITHNMEDKSNSIHNYDTLSNIDLDNIANHLNIQSKGMSKINSEEFLSQFENDSELEEDEKCMFKEHFLGQQDCQDYWYLNYQNQKKKAMINTSDYKWTENCYMKIKDVFPKLAAKLHKRYKFVQRMTYNKIGPYQCNTEQHRHAFFTFAQFVFGYIDDSYNYYQIKQLIPKEMQKLITKCINRSYNVTAEDYNQIKLLLSPHDLIHIGILIANAKMYSQIIFGMKLL